MTTWFPEKKPRTRLQRFTGWLLRGGPLPKHIAFIMDGNRRFARKSDMDTSDGHSMGFEKLAEVLEWCKSFDIDKVTVYAFSLENFKRSKEEVDYLMNLAKEKFTKLLEEKQKVMDNGVRVRVHGELSRLPRDLQSVIATVMLLTKDNAAVTLNVCLAYTSRQEICAAVDNVTRGYQQGLLTLQDIDDELIERCLYTRDSRRPDLLIRTSGEVRLSDFLLWQTSYSCLCFTKVLWPELGLNDFYLAILHYQLNYVATTEGYKNYMEEREGRIKSALLDANISLPNGNSTHTNQHIQDCLADKADKLLRSRTQRIDTFLEHLDAARLDKLNEMADYEMADYDLS